MAEAKFSREEAIIFGWDTMKNNLVFFISAITAELGPNPIAPGAGGI